METRAIAKNSAAEAYFGEEYENLGTIGLHQRNKAVPAVVGQTLDPHSLPRVIHNLASDGRDAASDPGVHCTGTSKWKDRGWLKTQ